jgi:hypothetical protein
LNRYSDGAPNHTFAKLVGGLRLENAKEENFQAEASKMGEPGEWPPGFELLFIDSTPHPFDNTVPSDHSRAATSAVRPLLVASFHGAA